jgi:hypothetical protein
VLWERNGCPLAQDESGRVTLENFTKNGVYCEKNSVVTVLKASRSEKEKENDHKKKENIGIAGKRTVESTACG